eukprot:s2091_g1.t1
MGVSHSMDREQVDEVLTQFEATTSSITGIEKKMEKVSQYMETVQVQRRALVVHAEVTTSLIDGLGESMADQSKLLYDYFATSFEHFAGLVEVLETSLYNLKLEDAPRQIQREFGPLLMPSVVLVFIITVSNCYFGFLLAGDESLAEALGNGIFLDSNRSHSEYEARQGDRNIIFLFATAHVVLIGVAIVYIAIDLLRRHLKARLKARRKSSRISLAGQFFSTDDSMSDESELEISTTKSGAEVSGEAGCIPPGEDLEMDEQMPVRLRQDENQLDIFALVRQHMSDGFLQQNPLLVLPESLVDESRYFLANANSAPSIGPWLSPERKEELKLLADELAEDFPHMQRAVSFYRSLLQEDRDLQPYERIRFLRNVARGGQRWCQFNLADRAPRPKPHVLQVVFHRGRGHG